MPKQSFWLTCMVMMLWSGPCRADPYVTATYGPLPGEYLLQFIVHNAADGYAGSWAVSTEDATYPTAPDGWALYQSFREVTWDATTLDRFIPPGESLGGFGFTMANAPGALGWWVGSGGYGYGGYVTPVLVPEPTPAAVLAAGLAALGLRRRRRR